MVFGAAMVGSLFSSDAWNNVTFAAAEVKDAARNLPRALAMGTLLVTVLYVMTNISYLSVLPLHGAKDGADVMARGIQFASQDRVGTAAAEVIFGASGVTLMAVAILISTFGANNGLILSGSRVYYAMSRDGLFFKKAGHAEQAKSARGRARGAGDLDLAPLPERHVRPVARLRDLRRAVFYALTTIGLFVLRAKRPDVPRPYRATRLSVPPCALHCIWRARSAWYC